jgi:FtsZ-binding cell division protein ZapB
MPKTDSSSGTRKANKEWVESELKGMNGRVSQAKSIAEEAKEKAERPHGCLHDGDLMDMKATLKSLKTWKFGGAAGVLVLIAVVIGNYYSLTGSVEYTQVEVTELKESQKEMKTEVTGKIDSLKKKIDTHRVELKKEQKTRDRKYKGEIKDAFKEALYEVRSDMKPRRRSRNNP